TGVAASVCIGYTTYHIDHNHKCNVQHLDELQQQQQQQHQQPERQRFVVAN
ncbi:unnamed protein product, partial [Ceratitis capitata]